MTAQANGDRVARSADGVPIHFEVAGAGEPTLVLIHGWAFDRRLWTDEARRLGGRHRVVTLDLAGHGQSGGQRERWTMAAFGEDVRAVTEAVDAKEAVLVAHSMGGPVALEAARRMPERVRGVVLVDTLLDVEAQLPSEQVQAMAAQLEADYAGVTTKMANDYLFTPATPPAVRDRVLGHALALAPAVSIALLRAAWAYDPRPALAAISAPIRAVSADKFPTNVEGNRRHMPGYDAAIVPGTGHYPMLEDPAAFAAALDRALGQVLSANSAAGGAGRA
jgi:pimeloyl-ACP methyl ester carboxylesterase